MPDWYDELDPKEQSEFDRYVEHFRREIAENLRTSSMFVSLYEGTTDVKFATELGMAIMFDKPILAVVPEGTPLPEKFRRVADSIVWADMDTEAGREKMARAIHEFAEERGLG